MTAELRWRLGDPLFPATGIEVGFNGARWSAATEGRRWASDNLIRQVVVELFVFAGTGKLLAFNLGREAIDAKLGCTCSSPPVCVDDRRVDMNDTQAIIVAFAIFCGVYLAGTWHKKWKNEEQRIVVIFECLLLGVVALGVAAFLYIPNVIAGIYMLALGLCLVLAAVSGVLIVVHWLWQETSALARLDQPGPKKLWLRRSETIKAATKVALAWMVAVAATSQITDWVLMIVDHLAPRYNSVNGRRMPPEEGMTWLIFFLALLVVLFAMRTAGSKFFFDDEKSSP